MELFFFSTRAGMRALIQGLVALHSPAVSRDVTGRPPSRPTPASPAAVEEGLSGEAGELHMQRAECSRRLSDSVQMATDSVQQ